MIIRAAVVGTVLLLAVAARADVANLNLIACRDRGEGQECRIQCEAEGDDNCAEPGEFCGTCGNVCRPVDTGTDDECASLDQDTCEADPDNGCEFRLECVDTEICPGSVSCASSDSPMPFVYSGIALLTAAILAMSQRRR